MDNRIQKVYERPYLWNIVVLAVCLTFIIAGDSAQTVGVRPREVTLSGSVQPLEAHVSSIIERAEGHFLRGKLNLKKKQREAARAEFDKAVDSIVESGVDVRTNERLQI